VGAEFHEGHGYPNEMLLDTVIIHSVGLRQEAVEDVERIQKVQVNWRDGSIQDVFWDGPAEADVTIPIGIEMTIVPTGWLNCGYRASYTTFYLSGNLSGNYYMTITLYIPEYDTYCTQTAGYFTVPPPTEPPKDTSTPGPSPTSPPPTNTSPPGGGDPPAEPTDYTPPPPSD
jgi:hypothetical protein